MYGCAADRQQASIVFNVAADMVRMCPALAKRVKILDSQKRLIYLPTGSIYQVLSADVGNKHGFNTHGVVFDELHTQETRKERAAVFAHSSTPGVVYPFRGKLHCMDCGKNYRRKMVSRGPAWVCGTYNSKGKEFCPTSKVIPEETLMAVTAEILGTDIFDEAAFLAKVERIDIGTENRLTYCFNDGSQVTTVWQARSRRNSWTADKREAARQTALQHETPERDSDGKFKKKDSVAERLYPYLTVDSQKELLGPLTMADPRKKYQQQYIDTLLDDVAHYAQIRKPRGWGSARVVNRISDEIIHCFSILEKINKVDIIVSVLRMLRVPGAALSPINYGRWLYEFCRERVSPETYDSIVRELNSSISK